MLLEELIHDNMHTLSIMSFVSSMTTTYLVSISLLKINVGVKF